MPEDAVPRDRLPATSSANLFYETTHARTLPELSPVPTGVAVFAADLAIRRYGERLFNVVHWSDFDTGGHCTAMETPSLLINDIRSFFAAV